MAGALMIIIDSIGNCKQRCKVWMRWHYFLKSGLQDRSSSQNEWQGGGGMLSVCSSVSEHINSPRKEGFVLLKVFLSCGLTRVHKPNLTTCPALCNILWQRLGTHRSLSVSVRVFCCRRWTMKTVTATPMMSPMATTPPSIPITPPGGPCGSGFSVDKKRNNSVRTGALWVIDAAGSNLKNSSEGKKKDADVTSQWGSARPGQETFLQ